GAAQHVPREHTDAHPRIGQRAAQTAWEPTRPPYLGLPKSSPRSSSAVALAGVCVTAEACTMTRSTQSSFRRSYPKLSAHANAECHIMRGQSRSWASSKRVQNGGGLRAANKAPTAWGGRAH